MAYVVHTGGANKHATIHPYWAHSQTHGMNWWEKMTRDVRLTSKNRLTSKSTDSSLTWIHSDREGAHKNIKTFRPSLSYELIMVMPFIIQSMPLFPTLYGPDLSHSPSLKPRWLWWPEKAHMLCVCTLRIHRDHTRHSVTTHLCLLVEASTTQRGCLLAVCTRIFGVSVTQYFRGHAPGTLCISDRYELSGENVCLQVILIRLSRPQFLGQEKALTTLKTGKIFSS